MRNVLSLFNGMSCLQIALKELNIPYQNYYSSEIDKYAIKVNQHNFPGTIQLGDVTKWREWDIDWSTIDLVGAGSPCQGFSFAGKQLAFNDPRSALFFVFVEIWQHVLKHNPNAKFLLENVKMKKEHELVISRYMNVAPIEINSALVSAQNRQRNYWCNINQKPYGLFGDMECSIQQPKDRGILLRDILESDVDEKYYLSEKMLTCLMNREKTKTFTPCKMTVFEENSAEKSRTINQRIFKMGDADNYIKVKLPSDKASCFTAGGHSGGLHSDMDLIVHNTMPRSSKTGKGGTGHLSRNDGKTYCLDTGRTNAIEIKHLKPFGTSQDQKLSPVDGKSQTLNAGHFNQPKVLNSVDIQRIRRLTPTECKRLQTIPNWFDMSVVSDTQQYRMLGNGWTVEVIKHILSHL